jgi:type IV pilus assembly protein PilC
MAELAKAKEKVKSGPIDFIWEGKDKAGANAKGEMTALTEAAARAELRSLGVRVIKIKPKPKPLFANKGQPITSQDISMFARQIATMMNAGVPLVQSFDIIGKGHDNANMGDMIMGIKTDVESGDTFAEALRKRPLYFDDLFCNLVAAGEQAGILEGLLGKIAAYKEKSESMRKKVKKALTYPIAVLVVAFIVTAILLVFVVPVFDSMFKGFGKELPAFTQMVVAMSEWMQLWWYYVVGTVFAVIKIWKFFFVRSEKFRQWIDRMLLQAPIFGQIIYKSALGRFARTLGTMSAAGVPLVEALESVAGACGNIVFLEAVMQMQVDISSGQRLQYSMEQSKIFPNMMMQMVAIGEESGRVDGMLEKVADYYDEEVDNLVDNLSALMEPFIMVILGTLIGGLIVAMYLPIFAMGEAVG